MFCIICGRSHSEVDNMFCFPRNRERLRLWQERLGMSYRGEMGNHQRVCNLHFEDTSFMPLIRPLRLRRNAVPKIVSLETDQASPPADHELVEVLQDTEIATTSKSISEIVLPQATEIATSSRMEFSPVPVTQPENLSIPSTPKTSRIGTRGRKTIFREIREICGANVTPRKASLIGVIKRKAGHIRKLKKLCKGRGTSIKHLSELDTSIETSNIFKGFPLSTAQFMISQIRCAKRSPYGRRWTLDDKIMSLAIYKRSPKCYALLRRLLALPSVRTLTLLLEKIPFNVGINEHIFTHLGKCLEDYPVNDRLCSLAFDEVAIREHIQYNPVTDCIEGVEDFGKGRRTDKIANYALVFYIQGICKHWKQPLAYYFSNGGASSEQIKGVLEEVLDALQKVNVSVFCIICDMGTANVRALKDMGSDMQHPYIMHCGQKVFTLFDIPHLLKCFRNLFRKYNVLIPVSVIGSTEMMQARWSDLCRAYEEDKNNPLIFRSLFKIKDYYLAPLRQNAMKVKVAAQTMSRTVSVYIFNLIKQDILPARALATAVFINEVDELFDSCNGNSSKPPDGKPYRCNVTNDSGHVQFWQESFAKVSKWRFIRKPEDETSLCPWKPPSQKGWLHNLQALPKIWEELNSMGINSLRTRSLNQDGLENLFGAIRSGLGCNENPTVPQFISSLKTQVINGLTNQGLEGTNCEEDGCTLLSNLRSFLDCEDTEMKIPATPVLNPVNVMPVADEVVTEIAEAVKEGSIQSLSVAYVSGFILKKLYKNFTCEQCARDLSSDDLDPCNYFISLREFSDSSSKLFYPSEQLVIAAGHAITILEDHLSALRHKVGIQRMAEALIKEKVNFAWLRSCTLHKNFIVDCIVKSICRIGIPWYCKRTVRNIRAIASAEASKRKFKKITHQ